MTDLAVREQDLFIRVMDKVNADAIRLLLYQAQEQQPGSVAIGSNKQEYVENLKIAVSSGLISRATVFSLLQDAEENGSQTILYYTPKNNDVLATCSNPALIAAKLFGSNWRQTQQFPKLPRLTSGWEVVDFRTSFRGKPTDWIMKLYTYQESKVQVRELHATELADRAGVLKEGEYAVVFATKVVESVCIVRWNGHDRHPLLELRVELSGRLSRFKLDVNAIWSRLRPILSQDNDFDPWELRSPLEKMLRDCQANSRIYQLGLANLVDSGEGGVRYMPYTENEYAFTPCLRTRDQ